MLHPNPHRSLLSQSWPLLKTVTLCPKEDTLGTVSDALQIAADSKRERTQNQSEILWACTEREVGPTPIPTL